MKTKDWFNRQSKDIYVKKAKNEGFVSRSAFKLIEIEKRYNFIKDSDFLLELGAAPGGWTKVILDKKKNSNYKLVCVDLNNFQINLNEKSIFIKCDFKDKKLIKQGISQEQTEGIFALASKEPNIAYLEEILHILPK